MIRCVCGVSRDWLQKGSVDPLPSIHHKNLQPPTLGCVHYVPHFHDNKNSIIVSESYIIYRRKQAGYTIHDTEGERGS